MSIPIIKVQSISSISLLVCVIRCEDLLTNSAGVESDTVSGNNSGLSISDLKSSKLSVDVAVLL